MGLLDDTLLGYQEITGLLNKKIGDYYQNYQDWGQQNRQRMPEWLNQMSDTAGEISELPGADMIVPAAPLWKDALPILQSQTRKFVKNTVEAGIELHPDNIQRIKEVLGRKPSKNLYALERLTEEYPSVTNAYLYDPREPRILGLPPVNPGTKWKPPTSWRPNSEDWVNIGSRDSGTIYVDNIVPEFKMSKYNPAEGYGHEASHVFTGPIHRWGLTPETGNIDTTSRALMEGYAVGSEAGLLNKFNNAASPTGYWGRYKNTPLAEPFLRAGELGADTGYAIREGKKVNQQDIIEQLVGWLRGYQKR